MRRQRVGQAKPPPRRGDRAPHQVGIERPAARADEQRRVALKRIRALPHIIVDRFAHRRHDRHDAGLRPLAGDPQRRADRQHVCASATAPRRRAARRRRAAAGWPGRARRSTARSPPRRHFRQAPWPRRARPAAAASAAASERGCAAAGRGTPCCSAAYLRKARTPDSSRAADAAPSPLARRSARNARRSAALIAVSAAASIVSPR